MQTTALLDLIRQLQVRSPRSRDAGDMARLLGAFGGFGSPAIERPQPRPGCYSRTCLHECDRFELVLIDWAPGSKAPLHDHGGEHCWFVLLEGSLHVEDYRRLDGREIPGRASVEATGARTLHAGDVDVRFESFAVPDLHRVDAAGAVRAQSLHVYASPIRDYFVYDAAAGTCAPVRSTYDAVATIANGPRA